MRLKSLALFAAAVTTLLPLSVPAVAASGRDQAVTANPVGLLFGLANVTYEHSLRRDNSWLAGVSFANFGVVGNSFTAIGAVGAYRFWFDSRRRLNGFYLGPELQVLTVNWNYRVTNTDYNASGVMFGGGGQGGHQWVFNNGFVLNLGASLGYLAGSVASNVTGAPTLGFGGNYVGLNFGLGVAF